MYIEYDAIRCIIAKILNTNNGVVTPSTTRQAHQRARNTKFRLLFQLNRVAYHILT